MGTWGAGTFDNDQAVDWTYGLEGKTDLSYVELALDRVLGVGDGYLEADDAQEAVAAVEAVARLQGRFGTRNAYTTTIDGWVNGMGIRPSQQLISKAKQALARIQQEPSELLEGWEGSTDVHLWRQALSELDSRIEAVGSVTD
ncbi:MAG TPA: DUF4259 domain-containing protein [Acetobacteraceae bacterium]|nr:DUF4259 domain-containing protein [Acetobacteraceae bacterium]